MEPHRKHAIEALYATGHHLLGEGRAREAAKVFRAMLVVAPLCDRAWLGLGASHEALDQPELALEMYVSANAVSRRTARCAIARARLLRALGRPCDAEGALDFAERAAELCEDDDALGALIAAERRASWAA
jgi:tetratricopeptide (TPR) repeat protein